MKEKFKLPENPQDMEEENEHELCMKELYSDSSEDDNGKSSGEDSNEIDQNIQDTLMQEFRARIKSNQG